MKSPLQALSSNCDTPTAMSLNSFDTTVNIYNFNDELVYAYRIFRELIAQHKKYILPIQEEYDLLKEKDGKINMDTVSKDTITFSKINSNFNESVYTNITEVISDLRLVIQNCYREFGYDHYLSKNARKIELVVEQKLNLIPRIFREKCTIMASNTYWNKEFLNRQLYSSRRSRSQPVLETSESILMSQLRVESEQVERERRRLKDEARRIEYDRLKNMLAVFEAEVITMSMIEDIKHCWELPCVGIYVYMLREFINITDFNYTEFELAAHFMDKSTLFRKIFTSLLATPSQRVKKSYKKLLTFKEWSNELSDVVSKWYKTLEKEGEDCACSIYGISPSFFQCFGHISPLINGESIRDLTLKQKMIVLKALCESVLESDENMCVSLATVPILQRQELYLGQDIEKHSYYFFPQFSSTDVRIFKQYSKSKNKKDLLDYKLIISDLSSLQELTSTFEKTKKSKVSKLYDLQQTLEALHDELKGRSDSFDKACEKGKLAVMKDYYAEPNEADDDEHYHAKENDADSNASNDESKPLEDLISARAKRLLERNRASPPSVTPTLYASTSEHSNTSFTLNDDLDEIRNGFNGENLTFKLNCLNGSKQNGETKKDDFGLMDVDNELSEEFMQSNTEKQL